MSVRATSAAMIRTQQRHLAPATARLKQRETVQHANQTLQAKLDLTGRSINCVSCLQTMAQSPHKVPSWRSRRRHHWKRASSGTRSPRS